MALSDIKAMCESIRFWETIHFCLGKITLKITLSIVFVQMTCQTSLFIACPMFYQNKPV